MKAEDADQIIAKRLRAARKAVGLSQGAAGKALGVTFQQVQKQENGSNRISAGGLAVLAELYKKPVEWFYESLNTKSQPADTLADFMSLPYAAEIARHYQKIGHNKQRHAVLEMTRALAGE